MRRWWNQFLGGMPLGGRVLVLAYALGFPLSVIGAQTGSFDLVDWLGFSPPLLWEGEVWTLVTYAFLSSGVLDWLVNLFWLATLVSVMSSAWSGGRLLAYTALTAGSAALYLTLLMPRAQLVTVGNYAILFGLLAAWGRLYRRERLILLGFGEVSVLQAAGVVAVIEVLILAFSVPWQFTASMLAGGATGWLFLLVTSRRALRQPPKTVESERVARLEL